MKQPPQKLTETQMPHEYIEIEVKFILPRSIFDEQMDRPNVYRQAIEQIYLSETVVQPFATSLRLPEGKMYKERRIRKLNEKYIFTAKGEKSADGTKREEYELLIDEPLYNDLKSAASKEPLKQIDKTRFSYKVPFEDGDVLVEFDDYHSTGGGTLHLDFVSCEIEVSQEEWASQLLSGNYEAPELQFLKEGINVTGNKAFSNSQLSKQGFGVKNYAELVESLK